jgi:site-specific DNA recombinase
MNNSTLKKSIPNSDKKVLIYCRESRDDYSENYERIETQRDLLVKFCNQNGYTNIVDIVMHDDMSGTDFSRFDEIREMIKNKSIDTLVLKDSSRLGRNQIEALKFVELLEEYGVELVFEGRKYDRRFFPLESWFNEQRAEDDSIKIRTNLRHKMEEGVLLIRSHYGYIKEDKKLVIDPETAPIVKRIFNLYLQGYGYRAIASILNEDKVPTPSQYRNNANRPIAEVWIAQHVDRILKNQVYTGCMVSGTSEKVSFKKKNTRKKPKEEWLIKEGTHEAIIDKETFNAVQEMMKKKNEFAPKTSKTPCEFAGLLYCGSCHSPMFFTRLKTKPDVFVCSKYHKEGRQKEDNPKKGCSSHRVKEREIKDFLKNHFSNILHSEEYRNYFYKNLSDVNSIKRNYENTLKRLEESLNKFKHQYEQVYNDKLNGDIPEFLYKKKSKELEDNITIIEKQLKELKNEYKDFGNAETNINRIDELIDDMLEKGFTKRGLNSIIDKIIVYDENEINLEDKEKYNIDDVLYKSIENNGGVVIVSKFTNIQYVLTNRWIAELIGTKIFDIGRYLSEEKEYEGVS